MESSNIDDIIKADVVASVEGDVERDVKGYTDGGDIIVKCRRCDKPVFKLVQVSKEPITITMFRKLITITKQEYIANCPYCNNKTWVASHEGKLYYSGIDDKTTIVDMDVSEPKDGVLRNTLEVVKNE